MNQPLHVVLKKHVVSQHKELSMNIRPLHNGILFQFEEETDASRNHAFKEVSDAGIITFADTDKATKMGRWGVVIAVGNSVTDTDVVPGARICIEPLQWTKGVTIEGDTYWKTDEEKVLAVHPQG